jgi:hypothetical protein
MEIRLTKHKLGGGAASISKCVVLAPPSMQRPIHTDSINGSWLIMLGCDIGKGSSIFGLEMPTLRRSWERPRSNHLCGNYDCTNAYHLVPESHLGKTHRVPYHKDSRCSRKQQVQCECEVGQSRMRQINDVDKA